VERRTEQAVGGRGGAARRPAAPAGRLASVVALQRMAGNRAVAGLMRDAAPGAGGGGAAHPGSRVLVKVKAQRQGAIRGTTQDGSFSAWEFKWGVRSPRDAATKQPSGVRQFKSLSFRKAIDAASPQLMQALVSNEVLDEVRVQIFSAQAGPNGAAAVNETIVFKNCGVAAMDQDSEDSSDAVTLVFESFQLVNEPGATSAADSIQTRAQ